MSFLVEEGRYGPRLVVTGAWNPSIRNVLLSEGIRELMLNYARGWEGADLSFLRDLDELIGLVLIHRTLSDDSVVQELHQLRQLQLSTSCSNAIDFSKLHFLEDCALRWRYGINDLFQSRIMQRLYISDSPDQTFEKYSRLGALESLSLSGGSLESTDRIEALSRLSHLGFFHLRRLSSLRGISTLSGLRVLELEKCPGIMDISELAPLCQLTKLRIDECGPIRTLGELQNFDSLEELYFIGSTKILDGNLQLLFELPRLRTVWFQNRRGYSHTREEVQAFLQERA
jgi:hypothetical protein